MIPTAISPWLNNNNGAIIVLADGGVLGTTSSVDFSYGCSPNVSSYGSSSFDVLNNGEVMGGELAPESCGRKN